MANVTLTPYAGYLSFVGRAETLGFLDSKLKTFTPDIIEMGVPGSTIGFNAVSGYPCQPTVVIGPTGNWQISPGTTATTLTGYKPIVKRALNDPAVYTRPATVFWEDDFESGLATNVGMDTWPSTGWADDRYEPYNHSYIHQYPPDGNGGYPPAIEIANGLGKNGGWGSRDYEAVLINEDYWPGPQLFKLFDAPIELPTFSIGIEFDAKHEYLSYGEGLIGCGFPLMCFDYRWGTGWNGPNLYHGGDEDQNIWDPTALQVYTDSAERNYVYPPGYYQSESPEYPGAAWNVVTPGTWQRFRFEVGLSTCDADWDPNLDGWCRVYVDDILAISAVNCQFFMPNQWDVQYATPTLQQLSFWPFGSLDNVKLYIPEGGPAQANPIFVMPTAALALTGHGPHKYYPGPQALAFEGHSPLSIDNATRSPGVGVLTLEGQGAEIDDFLYPPITGELHFGGLLPTVCVYEPAQGPTTMWFNAVPAEAAEYLATFKGAWDQSVNGAAQLPSDGCGFVNSADVPSYATGLTFMFWLRLDEAIECGARAREVYGLHDAGWTGASWEIDVYDSVARRAAGTANRVELYLWNGTTSTDHVYVHPTPFGYGEWHHVAVTSDPVTSPPFSKHRLYIDGVQSGSDITFTMGAMAATVEEILGSPTGAFGKFSVSEFRMWTTVLTAEEINAELTWPREQIKKTANVFRFVMLESVCGEDRSGAGHPFTVTGDMVPVYGRDPRAFTHAWNPERLMEQPQATIWVTPDALGAEWDSLLGRFVSPRLQGPQTIEGTFSPLLLIGKRNIETVASIHLHMYVTQGDTDAVRGTLLDNWRDTAVIDGNNGWDYDLGEWLPGDGYCTATPKALTLSLTPVTVFQGDRIVLEIGVVERTSLGRHQIGMGYTGWHHIWPTEVDWSTVLYYYDIGTDNDGPSDHSTFLHNRCPYATFSDGISWLPATDVEVSQVATETLSRHEVVGIELSQMVVEVLTVPPFIWLDVPNFLTEHLSSDDYSGGVAWVRADIWSGAEDEEIACRLYNLSDRVTVGLSATIMSTTSTEVEFPVQLTPGMKEYRLQVGCRSYGSDIWGVGQLYRHQSSSPISPPPPVIPPGAPPPVPPPSTSLTYDGSLGTPYSFGTFHLSGQGSFTKYRWTYIMAINGNRASDVDLGDVHGDVDNNTACRVSFAAVPGATRYRMYVFNALEGGGPLWHPLFRQSDPTSADSGPVVIRWKDYTPGEVCSYARPYGGWPPPPFPGLPETTVPDYEIDFYGDTDGNAWVPGD